MAIRYDTVELTTDSAGAGTIQSGPIAGILQAIQYVKDDFADGGTVTVTDAVTGATLWTEVAVNASAVRYPAITAHDSGGTSLSTVYQQPAVPGQLKVVVSGGGNTKTGTYRFIYQTDSGV